MRTWMQDFKALSPVQQIVMRACLQLMLVIVAFAFIQAFVLDWPHLRS